MIPTLWPTLPDLGVTCGLAVVVALTIGLGVLVGARRLETAFIAGWGVASAIAVLFGTQTAISLAFVMLGLGVAGCGGIVLAVLFRTGWFAFGDTGWFAFGEGVLAFPRVLLLGLPFLFLIQGMQATAWDDFSHWIPNLLYLCRFNHFPTLAQPDLFSHHAAYPYGLALPGYALHLLGFGRIEEAALSWNLLCLLAAGASIAVLLERRARGLSKWFCAALGLFFATFGDPGFVPKIVLTNMADNASAAGFAVLASLLFEWFAAPRGRWRIFIEISFTAALLVFLRQTNAALLVFFYAGIFLAMMTAPHVRGLRRNGWIFASPILAFCVWTGWNRYAGQQIPDGKFAILPYASWHWQQFAQELHSIVRVFLAKGVFTAMTLLLGVFCFMALSRARSFQRENRSLVIAVAALTFGNIGFLIFTYLATNFSAYEAATAASFWRYAGQTSVAEILVVVVGIIPLAWYELLGTKLGSRAAIAAVVLLPVFAYKTYRSDLINPVPVLRAVGQDLERTLPPGAAVTLLDVSGDGFAPLMIAYQMEVRDQDRRGIQRIAMVNGIPPAQLPGMIADRGKYLWLAEGSPAMPDIFGRKLAAGCAYLFETQGRSFITLRAWNLGPYLWETQIYPETPRTPRDCG